MSPVCDEKELTAYVGVVMKLEIHGIELVARKIARNDVGDESSRSNVASCLLNRRKKLRLTLMKRSLDSLPVMKRC
jgi:hypothetical protein